jgi:hypothetical protein
VYNVCLRYWDTSLPQALKRTHIAVLVVGLRESLRMDVEVILTLKMVYTSARVTSELAEVNGVTCGEILPNKLGKSDAG